MGRRSPSNRHRPRTAPRSAGKTLPLAVLSAKVGGGTLRARLPETQDSGMRPSARLRRLFERIARLFRRATLPVPPRAAPSGPARGRCTAPFEELLEATSAEGAGLEEAPPFGDFTDQDEVERFAGLPPIGAEALEGVDWDELARELTGPR